MVRIVKHKTAFRHWKEIKRLPEPEIVGRPRLSFDILQEVAMHCDVETAKNLGFICREMNKRMNAKILQPLKQHDKDHSQVLRLTIRKEKGVDELYLEMANEKTIVVPLNRFMRYIWYIPCDELEIYISKDEISAVWKQLYVHFGNVCGNITINSTDECPLEDDSSTAEMVLRVLVPMRGLRKIRVEANTITFSHMDVVMDHTVSKADQRCIKIKFPNGRDFSAEFFISVFESAPFSQLCHITILNNFDTVRPAIAAFASTQQPVPYGVFTKLGDNDISFELVSSGTKLHVSDRIYSHSDGYDDVLLFRGLNQLELEQALRDLNQMDIEQYVRDLNFDQFQVPFDPENYYDNDDYDDFDYFNDLL